MQFIRLNFLYRLLGQPDLNSAITRHELKRLPENRLGRVGRFFDVLGGAEYIFTLPGFLIPFAHWLWRIPTIFASATVISRELESETWSTLRTTTLSVRDIVLHKYSAVLRYMEPHYMLVVYIRAAPVIIFGVSWGVSTVTVLPERGFEYWASTTAALLFSGLYLLLSPVLDVAFDGALGVLTSAYSSHRSTALLLAVLARMTGFLLPMTLMIPLEYGVFRNLAGLDFVQLRAVAIVSTFGPSYAYLWGLEPWLSVFIVIAYTGLRLGLIRLMIEMAVRRAERWEI
ncbi:MAG: hypothetical protein JXN59_15960 [Anaerolineae bacterium]|nr:hypothetical protein [Anaerolineae bacterium]